MDLNDGEDRIIFKSLLLLAVLEVCVDCVYYCLDSDSYKGFCLKPELLTLNSPCHQAIVKVIENVTRK